MSRLFVWGAGGHSKVVLDCAITMGRFAAIAVVDDDPRTHGTMMGGQRVVGALSDLRFLPSDEIVLAIGANQARATAYARCVEYGFRIATLIHPRAVVSPSAEIQDGTVVMALANVGPGARIGRNCIVNTGAIVEHDCVIGDHVHLSPGVTLGGSARIGAFAHLGLGAIVLPGVHIGANTTVGAGAVAVKDLEPNVIAMGVPARVARQA